MLSLSTTKEEPKDWPQWWCAIGQQHCHCSLIYLLLFQSKGMSFCFQHKCQCHSTGSEIPVDFLENECCSLSKWKKHSKLLNAACEWWGVFIDIIERQSVDKRWQWWNMTSLVQQNVSPTLVTTSRISFLREVPRKIEGGSLCHVYSCVTYCDVIRDWTSDCSDWIRRTIVDDVMCVRVD